MKTMLAWIGGLGIVVGLPVAGLFAAGGVASSPFGIRPKEPKAESFMRLMNKGGKDELVARSLVLVDEKDRPRIKMGADGFGPQIHAVDEKGDPVFAYYSLNGGMSEMIFYDSKTGKQSLSLVVDEGGPKVRLYGSDGKVSNVIRAEP